MRLLLRPLEPPYYTILYRPINRADKRMFTFETDSATELLFIIDAKFLAEMLHDPTVSYNESFHKYERAYRKKAEWLNKHKMFKYIKVDEDYFYNEYYPKEQSTKK